MLDTTTTTNSYIIKVAYQMHMQYIDELTVKLSRLKQETGYYLYDLYDLYDLCDLCDFYNRQGINIE